MSPFGRADGSSLLCANCLSDIDRLGHPVDDGDFHKYISSCLRDGVDLSIFSDEVSKVNAFLTDVPEKLTGLNKAIGEMEHLLVNLKNARDRLQNHSDRARCLVSAPIRKLPSDVLNEIFTLCIAQNGDGCALSLSHTRISCPTLKLSWVCSLWRESVQSRPVLWSSLRLSSQLFLSKPNSFNIFLKYLACSRDTSLDIYYDGCRFDSMSSSKVDKAIDILLDNSMRWRRVHLIIPSSAAQDWYAGVARLRSRSGLQPTRALMGNFPALEYLEMPHTSLPWSNDLSSLFQTFSHCPRLHTYRGSSFSWAGHAFDFSHLIELTLSSFLGRSFAHLLCRLPALESLIVAGFQFLEDGDADDDSLRDDTEPYRSSISKLAVTAKTFQPEAWRFFTMPDLTDLQISAGTIEQFKNIAHLFPIIADPNCKLRSLDMHLFFFMDRQSESLLFDFLSLQPYLCKLTMAVQSDEEMRSFTEQLKPRDGHPTLLPNLCSLELQWEIHDVHASNSLCTSVCELVKSRSKVVRSTMGSPEIAGLQSLVLVLSEHDRYETFSESILTELSTLKEVGLNVDVQSDYE
ncbi:hypothetical protein BDP27DRAFT_1417442 [Rhodocollybia butyracea]|uniref:F-box domain-containing protein n=1 Tax=Rhodocollybia butyracea TaxID=206335 RepID=A0A9P5Q1V8_9AGAR|nr:hypothetical protein BDP27DRAFT_1417442 [Rhodocollybia butyracea]